MTEVALARHVASPYLTACPPAQATPQGSAASPVDTVDPATRPTPAPSKKGWRATVQYVTGAVLLGTTTIGGIGYMSNYQALQVPVQVAPTLPLDSPASPPPRASHLHASPSVPLPFPAETIQNLFAKLQQTPEFQKELQSNIAQARASIQQQLAQPPPIERLDLFDARVPLPTSPHSLLHVGPIDLPSFGWHAMQTESLPLAAHTVVRPGPISASVAIEAVHLPRGQQPQAPPGLIYLSSYHVTIRAQEPSVSVRGEVRISNDLDGAATRSQLAYWQQQAQHLSGPQAADARQRVATLEKRLAEGARLQQLGKTDQFGDSLAAITADQGASFTTNVPLDEKVPLLDGMQHIWLGTNADGSPRIVVSGSMKTAGIDRLTLQDAKVTPTPHQVRSGLSAWPIEKIHAEVAHTVALQINDNLGAASQQLPAQLRSVAQTAWQESLRQVQDNSNRAVHQFAGSLSQVQVTITSSTNDVPIVAAAAASPPSSPPILQSAPLPPAAMAVVLDDATVQRVMASAESSPAFQQQLRSRVADIQSQVSQSMQAQGSSHWQDLMEVHVQLPAQVAAMMPGDHTLTVPVVVSGERSMSEPKVRVEVAPRHLEARERPPAPNGGAYLGSYQTNVYVDTPAADASATVQVRTELDGQATRQALAQWQERAHGVDPNRQSGRDIQAHISRLQGRLHEIEQLRKLQTQLGLGNDLLPHQDVQVTATVPFPQGVPLVTGMHHLWLVNDATAKAGSRVVVTDQLNAEGLNRLHLENPHVTMVGTSATDHIAALGNIVRASFQQQVDDSLRQMSAEIPAQARASTEAAWRDSVGAVDGDANSMLGQLEKQFDGMQIALGNPLFKRAVPAHLQSLTAVPGGVAALVSVGTAGNVTPYLTEASARPLPFQTQSQPMAVLSGDTVNQVLRDVSEGGSMNWQAELGSIAQAKGLHSLTFDRGADGHLLSPQIVWQNGQPVVVLEVTAEAEGLRPLHTATGLLHGLTSTLHHATRGGGAKEVANAPISVLDGITGAIHKVVGATVGQVVDTVTADTTRPVVSLQLTIPLDIQTHDGVLTVQGRSDGLRIESAHDGHHSLLPTQLLGSAIGGKVARSDSTRREIGAGLKDMEQVLDLRSEGVRFAGTSLAPPPSGQGAPDLFLQLQLDSSFNAAAWQPILGK